MFSKVAFGCSCILLQYTLAQQINTLPSSQELGQIFEELDLPYNELGATVFALLYGTPLTAYVSAFEGEAGLAALGTNKNLFSRGTLTQAGQDSVVRPNVDTIYGISILDFTSQDIIITIPPFDQDRFYLFAFYDPFGQAYANLGSVDWNVPGDYLVRPGIRTGFAGLSETSDCAPIYQGCIDSPTYFGLLLTRVEVKQNTTQELFTVNSYIASVKINGTNRHSPSAPPFVPADLANLSSSQPARTLQLTANLFTRNPPQDLTFAYFVPWVLSLAGISNGSYTQPKGVNLTEAMTIFDRILTSFYANTENVLALNNGWSILSDSWAGNFNAGTNIVARAFAALFGYLVNTPDQAIYPLPAQRSYTLKSNEAFILTFSGKPPVAARDGFWSLTAYDNTGYLVANPANVYAISDRSGITYSDGTLVYGPGVTSTSGRDGVFEILVQNAAVQPPSNWTSNWLPTPADGSAFQLSLRWYAPGMELSRNGSYQYPLFSKVAALSV